MGSELLSCSCQVPVKFNHSKSGVFIDFCVLVLLRSWIVVNKILAVAAPLWLLGSHGWRIVALPLSHMQFILLLYSFIPLTHTFCIHMVASWVFSLSLYQILQQTQCFTSRLDFLYAHVDHHGPLGVVGFDQRGQVAAVHLLDVPQVRLAVVRHDFGALLMDIQPTVWQRKTEYKSE